jgi:hypothetical protein
MGLDGVLHGQRGAHRRQRAVAHEIGEHDREKLPTTHASHRSSVVAQSAAS